MTTSAVYNEIGKTYDHTRRADPEILTKLIEHLSPNKEGHYLDVGCGSGNYTNAIFKNGFHISGIDISEEMLEKARKKNSHINWFLGDAKNLLFHDNQFDGATCILATHHIVDIDKAFQEVFRVMNKGHFVLFTAFPEQMTSYWLYHYFPNMMDTASKKMHRYDEISAALNNAGFEDVRADKYFVTNDLQDMFLQSGKYKPHIYLDPFIRSGISTFALEKNEEEVMNGCNKIQQDICSGYIHKVIEAYESTGGDYAFVICTKK